jgi:hypothetical protein
VSALDWFAWIGFVICLSGILTGQIRSWQRFLKTERSEVEMSTTLILWSLGTLWEIWSCLHLLRFR